MAKRVPNARARTLLAINKRCPMSCKGIADSRCTELMVDRPVSYQDWVACISRLFRARLVLALASHFHLQPATKIRQIMQPAIAGLRQHIATHWAYVAAEGVLLNKSGRRVCQTLRAKDIAKVLAVHALCTAPLSGCGCGSGDGKY